MDILDSQRMSRMDDKVILATRVVEELFMIEKMCSRVQYHEVCVCSWLSRSPELRRAFLSHVEL